MRRVITGWHSPRLHKYMDIAVYGHYGPALLMFPSAAADFLEYERFHVIGTIKHLIDAGRLKVYSINSINSEAWLNDHMPNHYKGIRQNQFNDYIINEVVPFIHNDCGGLVPIYTTGVSFGALLSANIFFKRPDVFSGTLPLSGSYDLKDYTKGYFDDNVYFNSPMDYMPHNTDHNQLEHMRNSKIIIATGQGQWEKASRSVDFSRVLHSKSIPHHLDLWGHDIPHDWTSWRQMYPYFLESFC